MGFLVDLVVDWFLIGLVDRLPRGCLMAMGIVSALAFAVLAWFLLT